MKLDSLGECKVLRTFQVAHMGWELDNTGWVVQDEFGGKHLILSNHGQKYVAGKTELKAKLREYEGWIVEAQQALNLLKEKQ